MWLEDMNPRNLSTVQRERKILEIMETFCEENNFDDPVHLCNFAAEFANNDETASIFEAQLQPTIFMNGCALLEKKSLLKKVSCEIAKNYVGYLQKNIKFFKVGNPIRYVIFKVRPLPEN